MIVFHRLLVCSSASLFGAACGSGTTTGGTPNADAALGGSAGSGAGENAAGSGRAGASAAGGGVSGSGGSSNGGAGGGTQGGGATGGVAAGGAGSGGASSGGASGGGSGTSGTSNAGGSTGTGGATSDAGTDLVSALLALTGACTNVVSQHQYALDSGAKTDICGLTGAIFFTADMDIDCDGKTTAECNSQTDCCYQPDTAFHNSSDQPLTASVTPYVVIPQDFSYAGLRGGNVTAVIYQGKLEWAVFGDTGPTDIIGEASYACAKDLGIDPNPKTGGTGGPVTYITFVGNGAAPADIENQAETRSLGESLAAALIKDN